MDDELRLVPTTFGTIKRGEQYVRLRDVMQKICDNAGYNEDRYGEPVLAMRPAEPPIDRARVLRLLKSYAEMDKDIAIPVDKELAAVIVLLEGDV